MLNNNMIIYCKNSLLLSFSLTCDPSTFSFISQTFQESLVSETSMHVFLYTCIAIAILGLYKVQFLQLWLIFWMMIWRYKLTVMLTKYYISKLTMLYDYQYDLCLC